MVSILLKGTDTNNQKKTISYWQKNRVVEPIFKSREDVTHSTSNTTSLKSIALIGSCLSLYITSSVMAEEAFLNISTDGNQVTLSSSGNVGQEGLYLTWQHTDPAVGAGVDWIYVPTGQTSTSFWPANGAGVYKVRACEWDAVAQQTTICSDYSNVTFVVDVNGQFTAIPAADPAAESGSIALSANGNSLSWDITGNPGQSSGFMLVTPLQNQWQPGDRRQTHWETYGQLPPGEYDVSICAYDHYRNQTGICSNTVSVEFALNGNGQNQPVPLPDPGLENGTTTAFMDSDCEFSWEVTGNVGSSTGFMVITQEQGTPQWGSSVHRYAQQANRTHNLDYVFNSTEHQTMVCSYDYHRNLVNHCSAPVEYSISWETGAKVCQVANNEQLVNNDSGNDNPVENQTEQGSNSPTFLAGLTAWRTPDANGNSCASCHSPDGIDLAYPAYSREDILRRANEHVSPALSEDIANMIEDVRNHYNWTPTIQPREYRPFQPGGDILPGDSNLARDDAFSQQLVDMGLLIATGDINSIETAIAARDELLAVNLWELPIGIPFDRFSEDASFGAEHHRFNEWIPSVGQIPNESQPDTWYAMQDNYLQNPNNDNLMQLLNGLTGNDRPVQLNQEDQRGNLLGFESERFRSMLLLSHEQRREMSGEAPRSAEDLRPYETGALFHAGQIAYETWMCNPIHHGDSDDCMQLPMDENPSASFFEQMEEFALSWRYTGWLLNQTMEDVPGETSMLRGHYLGLNMKHEYYFVHQVFFRAMRAVRKFYGNDNSWRYRQHYTGSDVYYGNAQFDLLFMDQLMSQAGQGQHDVLFAPSETDHRARYMRFTANMYKMLLFLLQHELQTTGEAYDKPRLVEVLSADADHRWYGPVDFMAVLNEHQPERQAAHESWLQELVSLVEGATERDPSPGID